MLALLATTALGRFLAGCLAIGAVGLAMWGAHALGSRQGAAEVQARWDAEAETGRRIQAVVHDMTEALATRFSNELKDAIGEAEARAKEAVHAAEEAENRPVDPACRDVRRGLPADVLRAIDRVR